MSCFKCKITIDKADPKLSLTCGFCNNVYHIDCFGVDKATLNTLSRTKLKQLKCLNCINSSKPSIENVAANESLRDMIKIELETALKPILTAIEFSNTQTKEYMEKLVIIEKEVKAVKQEVESMTASHVSIKNSIAETDLEVQRLQSSLHDLEQFSRNCNVEISGIPESSSENLHLVFEKVSDLIGYDDPINLARIHRVPSRVPKRIKPIICQFNLRSDRDKFYNLARSKRNLDIKSIDDTYVSGKFFINDHLTQFNKLLLFKAKQFRSENPDFKFVWCRDGKVFMRKNENSKVIRVKTELDITNLTV